MNVIPEIEKRGVGSAKTLLIRAFSNGSIISLMLFILIFAVYVGSAENVLTVFSLNILLNNTVSLAVAAIGLTLIILIGGFDLSVGGVVVLANVILASHPGNDVMMNLGLVVLSGIFVGALNGFFVAYVGVQSIAATLATMIMCQGIALVIMPTPGGSVPSLISSGLTSNFGGIIPVALIVILLCIFGWLLFRRTRFGVFIYAIGADERAALQSGIPVRKVKFFVYVLAGAIYSLSGVLLSAQTASGDPNGSALFLLLVFAAVAIGGAKFGGGRGSALGSIIGAGILTVLQKTLFAIGVATFYTSIFQGLVLILAVLIGGVSNRLAKWREE